MWVEWDDTNGKGIDLWTLSVRGQGVVISQATVHSTHQPLCTIIPLIGGAADGGEIVVELRWATGSRHLHMLPPLANSGAQLNLAGLVAAGSLGELPLSRDLLAPCRSWRRTDPARGFGLELEFMTLAPSSHAKGCAVASSKEQELRRLILRLLSECSISHGSSAECSDGHGSSASLQPLLERLLRWTAESDSSIYWTSGRLARQAMLAAEHAPSLSLMAIWHAQERALRMLQGGTGTLQSEFK